MKRPAKRTVVLRGLAPEESFDPRLRENPYMPRPKVTAEICCNHKGDFDLAKAFIDIAKHYCRADSVKFQKRNVREVLTEEEYNAPHPNPLNSYGETYGQHREFLEFTIEQQAELRRHCLDVGIKYGCSVWDMTSLREIISIDPDYIKIPSATNTHFELLSYLCRHYPGPIHLSLGMTKRDEIHGIMEFLEDEGRIEDAVIYACTSGYPVPPEDVCLLEISKLKKVYGDKVKAIGFSGHHKGFTLDIAAHALGAEYIERHFTLDTSWKGTDHSASLEPDEMRALVAQLEEVNKALSYKTKEVLDIEAVQRKKLKWDRSGQSDSRLSPWAAGAREEFRAIAAMKP